MEKIEHYMNQESLDIEKIIDEYYGYVYKIVINSKSIILSNEDIEEIISDTFLAIWKNSNKLNNDLPIKPYLAGIVKNVIRNKYRTVVVNDSIENYEIEDNINLEEVIEEREKNKNIKDTLRKMKREQYEIFLMYYYEGRKIKEIASERKTSESKVKIILYRTRKKLKKILEKGGYKYGE